MVDIQVLVKNEANRRSVVSILDGEHTPITASAVQSADLYIVDDASFPQYRDPLETHKNEQSPLFCPVVLIRRERMPVTIDLPDPQDEEKPILINETLTAPIKQHVLSRRVANLIARREQTATLQRKNERLEEFASFVSHDLRNPLQIAKGRFQLVRNECESPHAEDVSQALDRMETLIEDLLTLARGGNQIGEVEPVALADLLEDCRRSVPASEATIGMNTDSTIQADRSRLQQLIENLLRNAIEHGDESVTITLGELETGFYVEDDGPGIPAESREEVFNTGYSTSSEGSGFGLRIVKQVVDAHGWEITVTEGEQGGARFEIAGVEFADS